MKPIANPLHPFSASWEKDCEDLQDLKPGWDGYDAESPSASAISKAKSILHRLLENDLPPTRIAPSVEGGVGIIFTHEEKYLAMECLNSNEILIGLSDGKGKIDVKEYDCNRIEEIGLETMIRGFFLIAS